MEGVKTLDEVVSEEVLSTLNGTDLLEFFRKNADTLYEQREGCACPLHGFLVSKLPHYDFVIGNFYIVTTTIGGKKVVVWNADEIQKLVGMIDLQDPIDVVDDVAYIDGHEVEWLVQVAFGLDA